MTSFPCKAVFFDLDGVLVDSGDSINAGILQWTRLHAIDLEAVRCYAHVRTHREMIALVAPHLDPDIEARRILDIEMEMAGQVRAQPDVMAVLSALGSANIPWAIVTSGQRDVVYARLRAARLPIPDTVVAAGDTLLGKPDPAPYLHAAHLLGIKPRNCLVLEDTPTGAIAGLRAGMTVVTITTTHAAEELSLVSHHVMDGFHRMNPHTSGVRIDE